MEKEDILEELGVQEPDEQEMASLLEKEDMDYLVGGKKISKRTLLVAIIAGTLIFSLLIGALYFITRTPEKISPEKVYQQKRAAFKTLLQEKQIPQEKIPAEILKLARDAETAYQQKQYKRALDLINRAIEKLRGIP